jgi:hypothetical protein|nr:MAG TPA: hypothetical protein [Caudoviricetes sp.]
MRIIPDFNKYSEDWQYDNPANFNANNSRDFDRYWEDRKANHNKYLDELANKKRSRSISIGKGIGVLGGGLVGGLTGNLIGRNKFNNKNPKDKFIEKYLYENPLAGKLEAESAYNKLRKKALIKSSLLGAGLGAGVGYIGGSQITKGIFNDRLQRARELGEKLISNRRNEIINNIGYFGDNYNSITVQDSTVDGKLHKNVLAKKIIENNKPTNIKEAAVDPNKQITKFKEKFKNIVKPKVTKPKIVKPVVLDDDEILESSLADLIGKFNDPNKNKSRRKY